MLVLALAALAGSTLLALAPGAHGAQRRSPTLAPSNTVIDGPSADIQSLNGLSVARDGTGGLVYLKDVLGVPHVFVSRLLQGQFQTPLQVDQGLVGPSSQPVIAASNGGLLLVAFINGGTLDTVQAPSALAPLGAITSLAAGAANPSLSLTPSGKAYLAFTATVPGGHDVDAAYYNQGQWAMATSPLDDNLGDNAGTGTGQPQVTASGDGVGIVAWGESGHIYTRRIWGTTPSSTVMQADPNTVNGMPEISATDPQVSTGGDSSFAAVLFSESLSGSNGPVQRVLMNRLQGNRYDGIAEVDGLGGQSGGDADQPQVAATEFGRGFVTAEQSQSHDLYAVPLSANEEVTVTDRVNSQVDVSAPDAVPAVAGTISTLIAWQQEPGATGPADIRLRYAADGSTLGPEQVVSSPSLGATNADSGLSAAGDLSGDAAVAWVQGTGAGTQIVAGQLYQPPGALNPPTFFRYQTGNQPVLAWSSASELWGPVHYIVTFDGAQIANTTATALRTPAPVGDGRHTWEVTAVNQVGLTTPAKTATVFVDTHPPAVSFVITGRRTVGSTVHIAVSATDSPAPLTPAQGSGIASLQVKWGDGSKYFIKSGKFHVYKRRRTYTVTVIAKDRAGNRTVLRRQVTIKPKPKPKPKRKPRKSTKSTRHPARQTLWRAVAEFAAESVR
jgi:hypothetical protein